MAKAPNKKKIDPLAIGLELLAVADKDSARAARSLFEALGEPFEKPALKLCEFKIGKKHYGAKLTSNQSEAILNAVKKNDDVNALVQKLLGALNRQVSDSANGLIELLEGSVASPVKGKKASPKITKSVLGCCHYVGGPTASLSQAQCNHYNPESWDPNDPNCQKHVE
jgi:hypothetical protein